MLVTGGVLGLSRISRRVTGTASGPRTWAMRASRDGLSTASEAQRSERTTLTAVWPSANIRSFGWSFLSVSTGILGGICFLRRFRRPKGARGWDSFAVTG